MDLVQLYKDYNVDFRTEGHKHCRPGWVNVECPFCTGNPGYHLGATLKGTIFRCWRCGWKPTRLALQKILNLPEATVNKLIIQYKGTIAQEYEKELEKTHETYSRPSNIIPLKKSHAEYLSKRAYDPEEIVRKWGVMSTGHISLLKTEEKTIDYSHRLFIPITWNGEEVSFQTRETIFSKIKQPVKYLACPEAVEKMNHKHILYGNQNKWKDTGICVEGVTDVWRLGFNSFATFGIEFKPYQVNQMMHFKKVFIIFDDETQAQRQARELQFELSIRKIHSEIIKIKGDPGGMPQDEADSLVRSLMRKIY